MAQRVQIIMVDDLDGTEGAVQTVKFGLDGANYEIDLNDKNAARLRKELDKYMAVARKSKRPYTRRQRNTSKLEVA